LLDYSSDEEVPGVNCSSARESSSLITQDVKNPSPSPLPLASLALGASNVSSGSSTDLLFIPMAGYCSCLVYIEVPELEPGILQSHLDWGWRNSGLSETFSSPTPFPEPLHVSLSRPFPLRDGLVKPLLTSLIKAVEGLKLQPFQAVLRGYSLLPSETRAHEFLTLNFECCTGRPTNGSQIITSVMSDLVGCIDNVLLAYGAPLFFSPPRFHASIALLPCVTNPTFNAATSPVTSATRGVLSGDNKVVIMQAVMGTPVDGLFIDTGSKIVRGAKKAPTSIKNQGKLQELSGEEANGGKERVEQLDLLTPPPPISFLVRHLVFKAGREAVRIPFRA